MHRRAKQTGEEGWMLAPRAEKPEAEKARERGNGGENGDNYHYNQEFDNRKTLARVKVCLFQSRVHLVVV